MKLIQYTLMYNESEIIPYVVDYWIHLHSQLDEFKVVVYDNNSTDNSVELLSKYPWIEIRHFQSDGHNDVIHQQLKQDCWKESKGRADWCCVCDFDEILWSKKQHSQRGTRIRRQTQLQRHRNEMVCICWRLITFLHRRYFPSPTSEKGI